MAKKRTTTRKTRQAAGSGSSSDNHPYRHNSKHISASPSVASSPSPQPHDLVQRRRKGTPVRSPSQGDRSKGIVFAFRIQPDSDLSMAVDILSYDQVSDEPKSSSNSEATTITSTPSKTITEVVSAPSIASTAEASAGSVLSSSEGRESSTSSQLKLAGEKWSSDPNSYLSNNVVDLTRNVLILHSRKPQDTTAGILSSTASSSSSATPYSRSAVPSRSSSMSLPSTPPMTDSSSYSSASSSPSSSPSSPMLQPFEGVATSEKGKNNSFPEQLSSALPLSLPLPDPMVADLKSQPPRMLRVRGLGNGARRMQVFVV
ncbi:hypothetical protein BGZ96_007346 [Linnemannia gamsii]|uniref:REJ domain-containing protein n=1 Tax=Linnemannia gamsii TaxID=64522 RepID=A0ABQ7K2W4_9FUNG|nr:hypothetical protein BGZ96_007346 [Linnemannia gamsii]